MGAEPCFATWQPRYAELGVAIFPVQNKAPSVKGYMKMSVPRSRRLVQRFGERQAFGISLKQAGVTIVDVDTPDERVLAEALDEHGPTPLIVRSGSGNFQAWYKHGGERRRIRPDPARPIDILGGGFSVAPPSKVAKGTYEIIQGSFEDIAHLPLRREAMLPHPETRLAVPSDPVKEGSRNDTLWRMCMEEGRWCDDLDAMVDVARGRAAAMMPPLSDAEVVDVAKSAWAYTHRGENWFGVGGRVVVTHEEVDDLLLTHPDAYVLLTLLRRRHWRREFTVANDSAEQMPGGGWARKRLTSARKHLETAGYIEMVHPPSTYHGPAVYRLKGGQK